MEEFLENLERRDRAKVMAMVNLLEEEGSNLRRPYADYLREGIYELRARVGHARYRILYFFCFGTNIVLTHAITKKSERVPEEAIERALRCRQDWLRRQLEDA